MLKNRFYIFLVVLSISILTNAQTIKVACIGNSITYGSGIFNRELNSYPAQLQQWLGVNYDVKNFGVSGTTMLKKGDFPYWVRPEFEEAKEFLPDVVLIKLGTNDTKPQNWCYADEYGKNYLEMISEFRKLSSHPQIVLLLPVPVFTEDKWGIREHVVRDSVIPVIRNIGRQKNCEIIDLYNPMLSYGRFFPDQVHPDAIAASIMVEEIYKQYFLKKENKSISEFNTAIHPVPSPEYRGKSAGWGEGKDWFSQHIAINKIGKQRQVDLVFLGNSITQGWGGEGRDVWSAAPEVWEQKYKSKKAANFGISGDRTQHIIWRIKNGNFENINPKLIILTIGVNNFPFNTAEEISEGIKKIVNELITKTPKSKILVLGPLPTGELPDSKERIKYRQIQKMIQSIANLENVIVKDIGKNFFMSDGSFNYKYFREDNIHLTKKGYEKWSEILDPIIANIQNDW